MPASAALSRLLALEAASDDDVGSGAPGAPVGHGAHGPSSPTGCVCAAIENRAKEIGMATLDFTTMTLSLSQFIETGRSYSTTQMLLDLVNACEVVVVSPGSNSAAAFTSGLNKAIAAPHAEDDDDSPYRIWSLPRACFDDTQGASLLQAYATNESQATVAAAAGRDAQYLALGAAGALLQHLTSPAGHSTAAAARVAAAGCGGAGVAGSGAGPTALLSGSLRVQLLGTTKHMQLDRAMAEALEVTQPSGCGRAAARHGTSLFSLLNNTRTKAGARLLRVSLLQPLTHTPTLNTRYDCVEELLSADALAFDIGQCLGQLPRDLDKMCASLAIRQQAGHTSARAAVNATASATADPGRGIGPMISSLLLLREVLGMLPALAEALADASSPLLCAVRANCEDEGLAALKGRVDAVLDEEAVSSRVPLISRLNQCFALRPAVDGMLDLARASFCRATDAIYELSEEYASRFDLPGLKLNYSNRRSFYLQLPLGVGGAGKRGRPAGGDDDDGVAAEGDAEGAYGGQGGGRYGGGRGAGGRDAGGAGGCSVPWRGPDAVLSSLPQELLLLERRGRSSAVLTSHALNALNARLKDAANDCLILTQGLLEGVLSEVGGHMPSLQRLIDSIALLDMVAGFAQLVGGGAGQWCRPQLQEEGPLAIVKGRHPLLEAMTAGRGGGGGAGGVVANDTYISAAASLHIVTGPNMAGKSTYIKQVPLLVLMAQAGCWVPAQFCGLCPFVRMAGRLGRGDNIETNSSSFMVEMQDVSHILSLACPRTLVVMDELGRATSTADGVGLAWAVCEELLSRGCPTLLATHFAQLAELAALYPQARVWRLQVDTSADRLDFTWCLTPCGALDYCHYGLMLAQAVGMPQEVLQEAHRVAAVMEASERRRLEVSCANSAAWATVTNVYHRFTTLALQWGAGAAADPAQVLALLRADAALVELQPLLDEVDAAADNNNN